MANKKISAMTPATLPIDGTEQAPIVQAGNKKISLQNLINQLGLLGILGNGKTLKVQPDGAGGFQITHSDNGVIIWIKVDGSIVFQNLLSEITLGGDGSVDITGGGLDSNNEFHISPDGSGYISTASGTVIEWDHDGCATVPMLMAGNGATGDFTSLDGKTVTVTAGVITAIV